MATWSDPATAAVVAAQLGSLVAANVITTADQAAIEALAQTTTSRAAQIGWPLGVSDLDVHAAKA